MNESDLENFVKIERKTFESNLEICEFWPPVIELNSQERDRPRMDTAEYDGYPIDKSEFKNELLKMSPDKAADVAFGLLKKANRLQKDLQEVSYSWSNSTAEVKSLKNYLKSSKKMHTAQLAANDEEIRDLKSQIERLNDPGIPGQGAQKGFKRQEH